MSRSRFTIVSHLSTAWDGPATSARLLWQSSRVSDHDKTREELLEAIDHLRAEIERLKEELRRARRDTHEVPPHYL